MMKEFFKESDEQLALYTKAITKAHGAEHPEVFKIHELYQEMENKAAKNNWNFEAEFKQIRKLTDNYTIPGDACGAMTTAYKKLAKLDKLSQVVK